MVKTTVYIEETTDLMLKKLAKAEGRSQAEIIREALTRYASQAAAPRLKGIGDHHSGRSDISQRAEELLWSTQRQRR